MSPQLSITFGLELDGPSAPEPLGDRSVSLGEAVCGPARMLELLETRLGLGGEFQPDAVRSLQYRAWLAAADDGKRFYCRSFRQDPVGTATTLLKWREELVAAGWDARKHSGSRGRLGDLVAVELGARPGELAPGAATRLRAVMAALEKRKSSITRVSLLELREELPPPWPRLLELLEAQGAVIEPVPWPGGGLEGLASKKVVVLEASSESEAAEALVPWLEERGEECVVLSPSGDDTLDRALARHGLPVAGIAPLSPWRPALQILPLAVAMRWEPLDPRRLLEFLLVPAGPLSRFVSTMLGRAVAREPGVGGYEWKAALRRIERAVAEGSFLSREEAGRTGRSAEQSWREQKAVIDQWLLAPRVDPGEGIPRAELIAICGRVESWAVAVLETERENQVAKTAKDQAATLRGMLALLREEKVTQLFWEALLDQAAGRGVKLPGARAELGHVAVVHHPGALLAPVERLVWWDFTEQAAQSPILSPWTPGERAELGRKGVRLEEPVRLLERETRAAERAMSGVASELILVVPAFRRGEETSPHPEMARIARALGAAFAGARLQARERALDGGDAPLVPVRRHGLPPRVRWWRLPAGLPLRGRGRETYTSLSDFLNHPFHWVLKFPAALSGGALQPLLPVRRLLGNLAHRLLQEALADPRLAEPARLRTWLEERIPPLLAEEGALLLLPARHPDRRRLARAVERSAMLLSERMRTGGWRLDEAVGRRNLPGSELGLSAPFVGGELEGFLDLLLVRRSGEKLVLDLKWGRRKTEEQVPLQLLVYGSLVKAQTGRWPRVAHLFLEQASLYPPDALDAASSRQSWTDGDCEREWPAAEAAWSWRRSQLDGGQLEVTVEGTRPTEESVPPAGAREPEGDCRFNEFVHLVGWEAAAEPEEDS